MRAGNLPAYVWPPTAERSPRLRIDVRLRDAERRAALARDVRRGLTATPRTLPPKYFYDAAGSELFEQITRLPEYYPTRAERSILDVRGASLMNLLRPDEVVEIGAGTCTKIRPLLRAVPGVGRFVPVDVDQQTMIQAGEALVRAFPDLRVHGLVGDFERHLRYVPAPEGRRIVAFFGSTIGNLDARARRRFLRDVRALLAAGDSLVLGVDLMKDPGMLHAAYDDAKGITAAFNRNVLRVLNRELAADFDPRAFRHVARVNEREQRVEMHLVAERAHRVRVHALGLTLRFDAGDGIWTESSYKFTRDGVVAMLAAAGLRLDRWLTDRDDLFALVTATPA
jgi:L-histidine N-alpha-methyltransferase